MAPPRRAMRLSYNSWSSEENERYKHLQRKAIVKETLWFDEETMESMGINHQVSYLIRKMDLGCFLDMKNDTYINPTLQFLSTVNYKSTFGDDIGYLSFKVKSMLYQISTVDLCRLYGFDANKRDIGFSWGLETTKLWKAVAFGEYKPEGAMISKIKNPSIRYTMEFLANTFFANESRHVVCRDGMNLMFQGLKHCLVENGYRWEDPLGEGANIGDLFARILCEHAEKLQDDEKPTTRIGGALTPLFRYFGIQTNDWKDDEEEREVRTSKIKVSSRLDINYLIERDFLAGYNPNGVLLYTFMNNKRKGFVCNLPLRQYTSISLMSGITFDLPNGYFAKRSDLIVRPRKTNENVGQPPEEDEEDEDVISEEVNDQQGFGQDFLTREVVPNHQKSEYTLHVENQVKRNVGLLRKHEGMLSKIWRTLRGVKKYNRYASSVETDERSETRGDNSYTGPRHSFAQPPFTFQEPGIQRMEIDEPRPTNQASPPRRRGKGLMVRCQSTREGYTPQQDVESSVSSTNYSFI